MLAVLNRVVASVRESSPFRCSRSGTGPAADVPCERARFAECCFSFLVTRALRSSRAFFEGSKSTSALAGTGVAHCVSASLFFPFQPHRFTHSCFSSSHTFLSLTVFWIPFARAKFSHFVGGLGFGSGFDRGSWVVGGGSWARGPSSEEVVGREKSEARRTWMPSRAVDWRHSSRFSLKNQ